MPTLHAESGRPILPPNSGTIVIRRKAFSITTTSKEPCSVRQIESVLFISWRSQSRCGQWRQIQISSPNASAGIIPLQSGSWKAIELNGGRVVIASQAELDSVVHKVSATYSFSLIFELVIDGADRIHCVLCEALQAQERHAPAKLLRMQKGEGYALSVIFRNVLHRAEIRLHW